MKKLLRLCPINVFHKLIQKIKCTSNKKISPPKIPKVDYDFVIQREYLVNVYMIAYSINKFQVHQSIGCQKVKRKER